MHRGDKRKRGQGFVRKLRTGTLNSGFLFYGGNKNLNPLFIRVSRRRGHFSYYFHSFVYFISQNRDKMIVKRQQEFFGHFSAFLYPLRARKQGWFLDLISYEAK